MPEVSIVILNYNHPEYIDICLRTLSKTYGDFEVIVVDNGSTEGIEDLQQFQIDGLIDKLILNGQNYFFSEGNNIGVRAADPASKWFLLLNSDVAFLRGDWLDKLIDWAQGIPETFRPSVWGLQPTSVKPGKRDIISCGWSHDANVFGRARPEGWCLLISREAWRPMDADNYPWLYGMDLMVTSAVRDGYRCGVLSQYAPFLVHREGGSGKIPEGSFTGAQPDLPGWYEGVEIETLDFTLGPDEHSSYMWWD